MLGDGQLGKTSKLVELRVDVHERIAVIMRADEKDSGKAMRREIDYYPERSCKVCNTDLSEKIMAKGRPPFVSRRGRGGVSGRGRGAGLGAVAGRTAGCPW